MTTRDVSSEISHESADEGATGTPPPLSIETLAIADIRLERTPRECPVDDRHVALMIANIGRLPPVLVRSTDRLLIDGRHRLVAARRAGYERIAVEYFEGSDPEAFAEAVRRNVSHGKPLTLAERERAAVELLMIDPTRSDRYVAECCGLAPDTVSRLRKERVRDDTPFRQGRDGRRRPVDPIAGRYRVAEFLAERDASDRTVAAETGVSPATVRDVRRRMRAGQGPASERHDQQHRPSHGPDVSSWIDDNSLRRDPESQALAKWLDEHRIVGADWQRWVDVIPLSRLYAVSDAARNQAKEWESFATSVEAKARGS